MDMLRNNTLLINAQLVLRGPKCAKIKSHTPLQHQQPEPLIQGRIDPCFYVIYIKFWLNHLNVAMFLTFI